MLCSGAATGLAFAVPSKRFRSELHSVPEGESLPLAERIVRAAIGIGLGVAAGVGHKERADFKHLLNIISEHSKSNYSLSLPNMLTIVIKCFHVSSKYVTSNSLYSIGIVR